MNKAPLTSSVFTKDENSMVSGRLKGDRNEMNSMKMDLDKRQKSFDVSANNDES